MTKTSNHKKPLDLTTWSRKEIFTYYQAHPETFTLTASIDITHLLEVIKSSHLKFNPVMIYLISMVVNQHDEFKLTIDDHLGLCQWERLDPLYSEMHPQTKNIMHLSTPYQNSFDSFYQQCLVDKEKSMQSTSLFPLGEPPQNCFQVSCVPWTVFTSFYIAKGNNTDFFPVITYGKYSESYGKMLLPISITLHHAVADGYHASRFISEIEDACHNFIDQTK